MQEGLVLADRYAVARPLGRGGLGEVWEARDLRLRRQVAVKFVTGVARHPEAARRIGREAEVLAALRHRGIVTVYDAGTLRGEFGGHLPYVVMELLSGSSWETARVESVLETAASVADALAHAHGAKIAHRDVKPANIMITADGAPVLLDFGIARDDNALSMTVTATGNGFGTPSYMAPEQLAGARGDGSGDVYALGLIVLEKLTGRRDAVDLDPARSTLGRGAAALLARMTSPVPAERPSAIECAVRLRELARPPATGPVAATRPFDPPANTRSGGPEANDGRVPFAGPQEGFDVVLTAAGVRPGPVLKALRRLAGLGRDQAKDLVARAPCVVLSGLDQGAALEAKAALEVSGATVRVVSGPGGRERWQTVYDVELTAAAGRNLVPIIKVVRELTELGLKEVLEHVERAPCVLLTGLGHTAATEAKASLEAAGAAVAIAPTPLY
ncbi:ribosomal protein L7/L12 [Actinomadura nitritigenes]|uniref:ribosomal protein L7/L12 n=1 Tax=Actinomadura nitritigenes TaxID=134602 RepID=UPI003D921857